MFHFPIDAAQRFLGNKREPSNAPWRLSFSLLEVKSFKTRGRPINSTGLTNLVSPLQSKSPLWPSHTSPFHSVRRYTLYKTLQELLRDVLRERGKFHDVNNPARNVNRQNKTLTLTGIIINRTHPAIQQP